jgi:hypothetical protein
MSSTILSLQNQDLSRHLLSDLYGQALARKHIQDGQSSEPCPIGQLVGNEIHIAVLHFCFRLEICPRSVRKLHPHSLGLLAQPSSGRRAQGRPTSHSLRLRFAFVQLRQILHDVGITWRRMVFPDDGATVPVRDRDVVSDTSQVWNVRPLIPE